MIMRVESQLGAAEGNIYHDSVYAGIIGGESGTTLRGAATVKPARDRVPKLHDARGRSALDHGVMLQCPQQLGAERPAQMRASLRPIKTAEGEAATSGDRLLDVDAACGERPRAVIRHGVERLLIG